MTPPTVHPERSAAKRRGVEGGSILCVAFMLALLTACEGRVTGPGGTGANGTGGNGAGTGGSGAGTGGSGGGADVFPDAGYLSNADVYTRLKPTCQGCHTMDQRPFFASLDAFENLVVYDTRYVVPQDPQGSVLIGLLRGTVGRQMPPAPSDMFAVLDQKGLTKITLAELEQWIRELKPRGGPVAFDPPLIRRKTAEQVRVTLMAQLGLTDADFYNATFNPLSGDAYPIRSPDAVPYADATDQGGTTFMSMGGPQHLEGKWRNDTVTPGFTQALVPISQAWCRTAVAKSGSVLLSKASLTDASSSPAGAAAIRANIAALYLRMLGEVAPQAEVDDLFQNVFVKYEGKGAATAWTAVCAALVRDPLWMLY